MKKIVSVIAVSAFLLLTLAGCGAIPDMDAEQEERTAGGGGRQADVDLVLPQVFQALLPVLDLFGILFEMQLNHFSFYNL